MKKGILMGVLITTIIFIGLFVVLVFTNVIEFKSSTKKILNTESNEIENKEIDNKETNSISTGPVDLYDVWGTSNRIAIGENTIYFKYVSDDKITTQNVYINDKKVLTEKSQYIESEDKYYDSNFVNEKVSVLYDNNKKPYFVFTKEEGFDSSDLATYIFNSKGEKIEEFLGITSILVRTSKSACNGECSIVKGNYYRFYRAWGNDNPFIYNNKLYYAKIYAEIQDNDEYKYKVTEYEMSIVDGKVVRKEIGTASMGETKGTQKYDLIDGLNEGEFTASGKIA